MSTAQMIEEFEPVCNFLNPAMREAASAERQRRAQAAQTEDDYLAAAESSIEDYIEPCGCRACNPPCGCDHGACPECAL